MSRLDDIEKELVFHRKLKVIESRRDASMATAIANVDAKYDKQREEVLFSGEESVVESIKGDALQVAFMERQAPKNEEEAESVLDRELEFTD